MKPIYIFLILLTISACSLEKPTKTANTNNINSLSGFFDCVRINNKLLISAHRGGPNSNYPENSLPALKNTANAGFALLELDIQQSKDGVLFLYHDKQLGRTSLGQGIAATKNWSELSGLNLKLANGEITNFNIPKLEDVLLWAKHENVILQLDIKPGTSAVDIMSLIKKTNSQNRAMLIAYTLKQAKNWNQITPDILLSLGLITPSDLNAFLQSGIASDKVIAWTGIGKPKPELYKKLSALEIEAVAGIMGEIDSDIKQTKNYSRYKAYPKAGAVILATSHIETVRKHLTETANIIEVCPLPNTN